MASSFLDNLLGGTMGDWYEGKGSLSNYRSELDPSTGKIRIFETADDESDVKEIEPGTDLYNTLRNKFTAEDDFDEGGTSTGLDFDKLGSVLGNLAGSGDGEAFKPIQGRMQSIPRVQSGNVSYRPTPPSDLYKTPSYLASSQMYYDQLGKMLGGLLSSNIRRNPIKLLV
jgi:hypothetical protein